MREIQASDAKARVPELLDVPEEADKALASILELRERTVKVGIQELLNAKEEGRKH